jgi:maleate isomerase
MPIYGHRARIGYTSPPLVTEVFPYEFYKIAPPGVTLIITTLAITTRSPEEVEKSYQTSLTAARAMAKAGAALVMLGGNPINLSRGLKNLDEITSEMEREIGIPVLTSSQSQIKALQLLGSRKVATVHPYEPEHNPRHEKAIREFGFEPAGVIAVGGSFSDLGSIPDETALTLARRIKQEHPEADTIHFASAHWATAGAIDTIERELGVSVMTSHQAITWACLRRAGIADKIAGFGRLLREF